MNLNFTTDEMRIFLGNRYYKVAKWPAKYLDELEEEQIEEIIVAFKSSEGAEITSMYWLEEIKERFWIENVFFNELKRSLLRL